MTKLCNSNKVTVVTGDFNYNIFKIEKNSIISKFLKLMYSNFLWPCILEPKRIVSNNKLSLIDIFINITDKIDSGNIIDKVSDHMPNFVLVKDIIKAKKYQKIKIKRYQKLQYKKLLGRTRAD